MIIVAYLSSSLRDRENPAYDCKCSNQSKEDAYRATSVPFKPSAPKSFSPITTSAALAGVKFVGCCSAGIGLMIIFELKLEVKPER